MKITAYITVNLLLFSSWYILLFRNREHLSFVDRLLGVFVSGLTQIIATEMVLGLVFKKLYATPLLIVNISISLTVLTIALMKKKPDAGYPSSLPERGAGGVTTEIIKEMKDRAHQCIHLIKSDGILLSVFVMFFVYLCYLAFIGYLFPSYSWDALLYHLPTVGFMLQSGAIENIPYPSLIYTFINVFPKNIDLFFLWNSIFLQSDVIVDLGQLPFTLAGMLSLYGIGRKVGIRKKYAVYSSLLFFFAPVIILQSTANYVDIAVSVLFLISLNFILCRKVSSHIHDRPSFWNGGNIQLFLAGMTSGLLLGSKGSGPLFIFALSILYAVNELRIRHSLRGEGFYNEIRGKSRLNNIISGYGLFFILPVILLGSYWYIHNWAYYGNPVYPFIVRIFGKTVFPGTLRELLHTGPEIFQEITPFIRPLYSWLERTEYYFYASDVSGFGPLWFILLLPCTVFSILISLWKKKFDFFIVSVMMVLVFLVYPNNWFTRYVIFLYGLGCLAFGLVVQCLEKRGRTVEYLALMIVLYTFLASHSQTVTPLKMKEFLHMPSKDRTLVKLEPSILNRSQRKSYGLWSWVSNNALEGDTLAYTFTPEMISPLWNSGFSNKIVFLKAGNFKDWVEKLEAHKTTYVIVLRQPRSMEYVWLARLTELRDHPKWSALSKKFRLTYYDSDYAVFSFMRSNS